MTRYIAAYDAETPQCLDACRRIVEVHRRFEMPATVFIVGSVLEADAPEYRALLEDPLFEVATHTYSHSTLRDHPFCGKGLPKEEAAAEIKRGKEAVEAVFERECLGMRPACGFPDGLIGAPHLLRTVRDVGLRYVSSAAWGPDHSLPAPLRAPFRYDEDGFPDLWELPGHGWHENVLKNHTPLPRKRLLLWPPSVPDAVPPGFVATPEEEFAVHRTFVDRAVELELPYVSLIWHPWSLARSDPQMHMLELTFQHVREKGLEAATFAQMLEGPLLS